jgi:hypothetical protein
MLAAIIIDGKDKVFSLKDEKYQRQQWHHCSEALCGSEG